MKSSNFLLTLGISSFLIVILVSLYIGLNLDQKKIPSSQISKEAQLFSVPAIQSLDQRNQLNLKDFRSKIVVLNFWASWCYSCRDEARDFEALWQKYKTRGVVFIGIAIQDEKESALEFAKTFGKTYWLGLDPDGKSSIDYGVTGVPESFLIDSNGVLVFKETGAIRPEILEQEILKLL